MSRFRILVVDDSPSILRVVEGVLAGAGYDVATASDGGAAPAACRAFRPDLVLLDFQMPRLNGYQVARLLHDDGDIGDAPIILMCSKGDAAAERYVQQLGIVDFITKPFSPDAILALVSYTLDKKSGSEAGTAADVEHVPSAPTETIAGEQTQVHTIPQELLDDAATNLALAPVQDDVDAPPRRAPLSSPRPPLEDDDTLRVRGAHGTAHPVLRDALMRSLGSHLVALGVSVDSSQLAGAVDEALAHAPPLPDAPPGNARGEPVLWGDLARVPIPEVFQLMTLQGQTGLFQVWVDHVGGPREANNGAGPVRFDVYFGQGKVDFVQAANVNEDFLLGRFLIARGAIEKSELDGLLRARKGGGKLLGQQLVALGHITRQQLAQALRDQGAELVYELLRFRRGTFCLRHGSPPPGEMADVHLAFSVDELLLEGLRRVDEWGVVEKEIDSFDVTFELGRASSDALSEDERHVLGAVTPGASVRQIIARSQMRPFDVCKVLYRLLLSRHLRKG